ncbi:MAG: GtrA family protein [Acutalibacteraceae bacterium]
MSKETKKTGNSAETQKLSTKENVLQTVKFALFSVSAGVIQITTYTLFFEVCHFREWVAYLVSLVLSVLWNFTFNRKFTFKSAANVPIAMLKVAAYYCVFTPISTWFTKYATADLLWNNYLVEAICMVTNFVTEFLFDRFVVFRNSINTNDIAQKEREKAENKDKK